MRVTLTFDTTRTNTDIANCLARVTTHEIGHTIGLLGHSPDTLDLMSTAPRARQPTRNDRITAQVLYHTRADLLPEERRQ